MATTGERLTTLIAGATGMVGSELLTLLLADPAVRCVQSLVRRPSGREHPRLIERVIDFDLLPDVAHVEAIDEAYCCLGTTMRAAGSRDAFRRVDHDYVVAFGRLAVASGARSCAVISSVGASQVARSFYLRVKGGTERDLHELAVPGLAILRPSLLLGARREARRGERIGEVLLRAASPLLRGPLARYRPVHARAVARAMVAASRSIERGAVVLEYHEIVRLGREGRR